MRLCKQEQVHLVSAAGPRHGTVSLSEWLQHAKKCAAASQVKPRQLKRLRKAGGDSSAGGRGAGEAEVDSNSGLAPALASELPLFAILELDQVGFHVCCSKSAVTNRTSRSYICFIIVGYSL